ncbi:hypothetical protein EW026_g1927 [Hermanssonia centrifuga]|uniref:Uncharacterized protein n=1 Tax=Hermanssonia centrifuga TaxID=98765 RepID=A0A4S4KQU2_9APHY|nr:hypothetical protein EW026_g1927 [Hermanssonia centrifuga]
MRNSAQILVYIDVQKAMDAGIKFFMSANGVVLTEGDSKGYLRPEFFARVVTKENEPILDWNQPATQTSSSAINQETGESPDGESTTAIINSATDPIEDVQQKTDALVL